MNEFDQYFANPAKQKRSHDRIERILDTTEKLALENTQEIVEARSIIGQMHISIGAIYHHFPSIGNIFASLMIRRIARNQLKVINVINQLNNSTGVRELTSTLVNLAFQDWSNGNLKVRNAAIRFFYRNAKQPELFFSYGDAFIPHLQSFVERNTTNEFRKISSDEWPLLIRVIQTAITSPFIERLEMAGSEAHKQFASSAMIRILVKHH